MTSKHEVLVVGGGAAGLALTSSLLKRKPELDIAVIEPAKQHYYQPGWTMVGGGVFGPEVTVRPMDAVWPAGVERIAAAAAAFEPDANRVVLDDGVAIEYRMLVVAPGLELNWAGVEGLEDALGKNGVTSNYRFDLAPYTWKLVQETKGGAAIFTQPPMPIKCAGAPQKAMYLACSHWRRMGTLYKTEVSFCNAGKVLFGCAEYVPPLMKYVEAYGVKLDFGHDLKRIDGAAKKAWFAAEDENGDPIEVERDFEMIHVCPPQRAPKVVRESPLAGAAGWVEVDPASLRHTRYENVFSLGDASSTPNAKTAAAARKQAPIVAENLLAVMNGEEPPRSYDGYGSCPLTVEHGKIILAEFGYGGKVMPTFPWDSAKPRASAWHLKKSILPAVYWHLMLKGREWLTGPAV